MSVAEGGGYLGKALVTGASSGIGQAFAERLAADGYDLVVVARRGDRLRQLATRLEQQFGRRVEVVVADLTQPADVQTLEHVIADDAALEVVVNNAGVLDPTPVAQLDLAAYEAVIRLHIVALVRLTRTALPGMLARGRGSIINLASFAAFFAHPEPWQTTYCATKAYVVAFTQGLHEEVRGTGVRVQALCPGLVPSEIFAQAGIEEDFSAPFVMIAEALVDASLAGLRLGEVVCLPDLDDVGLLAQFDALKERIVAGVVERTTGVPAERYRHVPPDGR
jgi:short-subunit dehydrogenase